MGFYDNWIWLIFVAIGLVMVLAELILGVFTGLDLVFLGSAFILGGLITWPFHAWVVTLVVSLLICVAYVAVGRRFIHRWTGGRKQKTNIDTIIGKKGFVLKDISPLESGLVKVGHEEWRATAAENIEKDEEIVVTGIAGVTLSVERYKGG